jgi:glycosyltransferase involved in cell wall biosynthesis
MPVYNGEKYLSLAISSILSQTFSDFELIISDNGSSDRTQEICEYFAASDARVHYIRQPKNMGAAWNFNHVFELSRGEFFTWHSHDDLLEPTFLEKCLEVLTADAGCILAYPKTIIIDDDGNPVLGYIDYLAIESDDPARRLHRYLIPPGGEPNPIFGLMRRDAFLQTSGFGSYVSADRVFLSEIALVGRSREVAEPLFLRRLHPGISVRTHADHLSREEWFAGGTSRGLRFRNFRLVWELGRSIWRATISPSERLRCYLVLSEWAWRSRVFFVMELALPFYANGQPTALGRWLYTLVWGRSKFATRND